MSILELLRLGDSVTTVGVCLAGLAAFIRGWIVPGSTQTRLIEERNQWQKVAVDALQLGKRTVDVVDAVQNGREP